MSDQTPRGQERNQRGRLPANRRMSASQAAGWTLAESLLALSALNLLRFGALAWRMTGQKNPPVTELRVSAVGSQPAAPQFPPPILPLGQTPAASLQQGLRAALLTAKGYDRLETVQ